MEIKEITPLWSHQREGYRKAKDLKEFAFFYEVGCGKTLAMVHTLRHKFTEYKKLLKTLIIGPPIILENWKREIISNSTIPEKKIHVLNGTGKKRAEKLNKLLNEDCIIITNYETLTMDEVFNLLMDWKPDVLILDEAHRCKTYNSKRTKRAITLSDTCYHKYLLTGTPILNSLWDIWSQFRILDGGETFGTSFHSFKGKYFRDKNAGAPSHVTWSDWVPLQGAEQEIHDLMKNKSMFVEKSECLDLPPLVRKIIEVPISPEQEKAYKEMQRDFITYIDGGAAVAELAVTKALRLQQIVTGHVKIEDAEGKEKIIRFKSNPRKDALKELLTDIAPNHKVLIWAVFKENYKDIREVCESLKLEYVEVNGDISSKQKTENVDRFNNDKNVRVFIGHPASGGIGITMVVSNYSIFYSRNFSLENDVQAEARNYRGGSEMHDKVTRIDLVCPSTIDLQVLETLASKEKIGYNTLKGMFT